VEVFDDYQHWAKGGKARKELRQRLDVPMLLLLGLVRAPRRQIGYESDQIRQKACQLGCGWPKHRVDMVGGGSSHPSSQQIQQRSIGQYVIGLEAATLYEDDAVPLSVSLQLRDKPRFANASLATHQHRPPMALACLGEHAV
jgi:hypothetical protein